MRCDFGENSDEWLFFRDFWKLIKEFGLPEEEEWERLKEIAKEITQKYPDKYFKDLIFIYLEWYRKEIER